MKTTILLAACLWAGSCSAQQAARAHSHVHAQPQVAPPPFIASSATPYATLAGDAMAVMDDGMRRAPANGDPGHDFVAMMIPHHQGAIDMAKAILAHSTDPELRNLAQGIIAEQQNEISIMRAWLQRYQARTGHPTDKESHASH